VDCDYEWEVKPDWGINDHNMIRIRMYHENVNSNAERGYRWKGMDWEGYMSDLRESALSHAADIIETNVEELLRNVMSWIRRANDHKMKRYEQGTARKGLHGGLMWSKMSWKE